MLKTLFFALVLVFAIEADASRQYLPVVLWHGMGDSCCNEQSMGRITALIQQTLPGTFVYSINTAGEDAPADSDSKSSFFGNFNDQVAQVCSLLKTKPELSQGFNAIGFSQGGQALRAYIERCNTPRVHNLVTFGAQHAGVADLPRCEDQQGGWCALMRFIAQRGVYTSYVQNRLIQAQYFKDPARLEDYREKSIFLADINNERTGGDKSAMYKRNLASLTRLVLVKFEKDSMVVPKESAWFGFYDTAEEGSVRKVVNLRDQPMYKEDWLGLKQLDERGGLIMLSVDADHLRITNEFFVDVLRKYLSDPVNAETSDNSISRAFLSGPGLIVQDA